MTSVNREVFEKKCKELQEKQKSKNGIQSRSYFEVVMKVLREGKASRKNPSLYKLCRSYELLHFAGADHLITKRKLPTDPVVYVVGMEDYYPKLIEAHDKTGHGGRDKMLAFIRKKWKIPRSAVEIFPTLCEACLRKRSDPKIGVVVKPIISYGFNSRGQVDIIDFQSCRSEEGYCFLMNYQDHATKFLHLRPLQNKEAKTVADELSKIFFTFGAPAILQSDNGWEFTAKVLVELVTLWPECKIIHGTSRHPQSQGSVERANADVENILRARMASTKVNDWSQHCYAVQWQKNTSRHRVMDLSPYEALLGPVKCGVYSMPFPKDVLENIKTEEQFEQAVNEWNGHESNTAEHIFSQDEAQDV